jgi:hypothetical protein
LIYVPFQVLDLHGEDQLQGSGEADITSLTDTAIASTSQYGVGIVSNTQQEGEVPSTSGRNYAVARASSSEHDEDCSSSSVDDDFEMDV